MIIKNMNFNRSGQVLDLGLFFPALAVNRYTITQTITNCRADYSIRDNVKGQMVIPTANHRVYLRNANNTRMSYTMKEIVRTVYDSEYCMIDDIQDLDGEEWYFIEEGYDKLFHKYRESYLVSNYARVKSYIGYEAVLMTVKPYKGNNDYYMVNFRDGKKRLRRRIHRIVAYHFLLPLMPKGIDFTKCEVHHWRGKENNEARYLSICIFKEQHERYDRIRRGIIKYCAKHPVRWLFTDLAA